MANNWGGARPGAGRPKGSVGPVEARKQRQLRARDDEWELIKSFDKKESKVIGLEFIRNLAGFTEQPYHEMTIAQKIYFLQEKIYDCKRLLIEMKINPMPDIDDVESVKKSLEYYVGEARKLEISLDVKGKIFSGIWD